MSAETYSIGHVEESVPPTYTLVAGDEYQAWIRCAYWMFSTANDQELALSAKHCEDELRTIGLSNPSHNEEMISLIEMSD